MNEIIELLKDSKNDEKLEQRIKIAEDWKYPYRNTRNTRIKMKRNIEEKGRLKGKEG